MNRICTKNLVRNGILEEIRDLDSDEAFAPRKLSELWEEYRKLARIAISYCPLCKRSRYAPTDAKCSCAPSLDKDKQPRLVGTTNRHMNRAKNAVIAKLMKDFHLITKFKMQPVRTIKFSEELKNAQQATVKASEGQGTTGENEAAGQVTTLAN